MLTPDLGVGFQGSLNYGTKVLAQSVHPDFEITQDMEWQVKLSVRVKVFRECVRKNEKLMEVDGLSLRAEEVVIVR